MRIGRVAASAPHLFVVLADSRADDLGRAKIERRALDRPWRPRQRDRAIVDGALALAWTAIDIATDAALRQRLLSRA